MLREGYGPGRKAELPWVTGLLEIGMIYNGNNAAGSKVIDMDTGAVIGSVLMTNTKTGAVVVAKQPVRPNHKGKIDRETITFRSIHPIQGLEPQPVLFHCYGRQ